MKQVRKVRYKVDEALNNERTFEFTLPDGTVIRRGDPVSVRGVKGNYRLSYVWRGQPVVYGGETGYGQLHSFRIELLGTVKQKHRRNLSDEQRQALRDRMAQVRAARKAVTA